MYRDAMMTEDVSEHDVVQRRLLRPRYMDPTVGRFTSFDDFEASISDPLHLHKYNYAGSDPVNNVDPSGNDFTYTNLLIASGIGALIGSVAGGGYAAYTGKSIWKDALLGAGLGAVAGAGIYLAWGLGSRRTAQQFRAGSF